MQALGQKPLDREITVQLFLKVNYMTYDKKLLEEWCKMPDWETYLEENGGLTKYASSEGFNYMQEEFFRLVEQRITYCERLVREQQDILIYYTLAQLYNRCDLNKSPDYLYKHQARYYCLEVLKLDPDNTSARQLLNEINTWVKFLDGEQKDMPHVKGKIINENEIINFEW